MKPNTGKLCDEYAWATECQLATLSGLMMRKRSPKSEITRATSISLHMLMICRQHHKDIKWEIGAIHQYGRVQELLQAGYPHLTGGEGPIDIAGALERWKETQR